MLTITSHLIFFPAIIALYLSRWIDVFIIALQAITAVWYHSYHTTASYYADQVAIWLLACHTLLLARTSIVTPYLFVVGFGYMVVVYCYGKRNKCFCFDENILVADLYHGSIHILGIAIYSVSMLFFLPYESGGIFDLLKAIAILIV
jgi:hypothetical protein